ncbi:hypothetical protein KKF84_10605 [Myxococcota bacterium]|nr:hypothetical protein [Myxococcota bacterium]MBU1535762.1 hypothetical protein [Myxococcota bacterium]
MFFYDYASSCGVLRLHGRPSLDAVMSAFEELWERFIMAHDYPCYRMREECGGVGLRSLLRGTAAQDRLTTACGPVKIRQREKGTCHDSTIYIAVYHAPCGVSLERLWQVHGTQGGWCDWSGHLWELFSRAEVCRKSL